MLGPLQERHVDILARDVLHRRVRCFAQCERVMGICNHAPAYGHSDARRVALDRDGVVGSGNSLRSFDHGRVPRFRARSRLPRTCAVFAVFRYNTYVRIDCKRSTQRNGQAVESGQVAD